MLETPSAKKDYNMFVTSTNPKDTPGNPDVYPSVSSQADNLRKAFAVMGALIANGALDVNFSDKSWHDRFESLTLTVAETLNTYHG